MHDFDPLRNLGARRVWVTVLRPLEMVKLPSREAMEAKLFTCFASVFWPTGMMLYQTLDVGLFTDVKKKLTGTLSPFGRWPTYSTTILQGDYSGDSNTPSFNMQALPCPLAVLSAIRITVILAFSVFCVNLCPAVEPTPISTSLYQTLIVPGFATNCFKTVEPIWRSTLKTSMIKDSVT